MEGVMKVKKRMYNALYSQYHKEFYKEPNKATSERTYLWLKKNGFIGKGNRWLEIGSGVGGFIDVMIDKGERIIGTDIAINKRKHPHIIYNTAAWEINDLAVDYDIIFSRHVLEHLDEESLIYTINELNKTEKMQIHIICKRMDRFGMFHLSVKLKSEWNKLFRNSIVLLKFE